ncbi:MAG: hypothetical protein NTY64_13895, partial [Deltaproteobacteria bacterium]|nr:hypothetical protein [Deltaproteobacteria bacterium]
MLRVLWVKNFPEPETAGNRFSRVGNNFLRKNRGQARIAVTGPEANFRSWSHFYNILIFNNIYCSRILNSGRALLAYGLLVKNSKMETMIQPIDLKLESAPAKPVEKTPASQESFNTVLERQGKSNTVDKKKEDEEE